MANEYTYTDLPLSMRFSDDGEYAMIDTTINGVALHLLTLYVGDQRELFQQAHDAGQPSDTAEEDPAATKTAKPKG